MPKNEYNPTFVEMQCGSVTLEGNIFIPSDSIGLVLFVHGSGSSRMSPRNRFVARMLSQRGLGTLLFDLLTRKEEEIDAITGHLRFDIMLLSQRLMDATGWVLKNIQSTNKNLGYFGASTGAAAALVAASQIPKTVKAIVSRGGRPDLAGSSLGDVRCPSLFLVGSNDEEVIELNKIAMDKMTAKKKLVIIPGATHLFEEPGKLELVAQYAGDWFSKHLGGHT